MLPVAINEIGNVEPINLILDACGNKKIKPVFKFSRRPKVSDFLKLQSVLSSDLLLSGKVFVRLSGRNGAEKLAFSVEANWQFMAHRSKSCCKITYRKADGRDGLLAKFGS